jgi:hypothetical protein
LIVFKNAPQLANASTHFLPKCEKHAISIIFSHFFCLQIELL